ncbi:MAG: hypothetical protein ACREEM_23835 [Blastocatellia bacterium]
MTMTPSLRNFALTAHVTSSVGWLGAVAGFLALAIAGLTSQDARMVRAAYLAMELIGWFVIVPCCLAALLTGLVISLGTTWGLFGHYWVVVKFLITIVSTLILFGFTPTLGHLGDLAANTTLSIDDLHNLGQSPVLHSGGDLLALLVTTTLSVYKPRGMTRYGRRKQREQSKVSYSIPTGPPDRTRTTEDTLMADLPSYPDSNSDIGSTPRWVKVFGIIVIVLLLFRFWIHHATMAH